MQMGASRQTGHGPPPRSVKWETAPGPSSDRDPLKRSALLGRREGSSVTGKDTRGFGRGTVQASFAEEVTWRARGEAGGGVWHKASVSDLGGGGQPSCVGQKSQTPPSVVECARAHACPLGFSAPLHRPPQPSPPVMTTPSLGQPRAHLFVHNPSQTCTDLYNAELSTMGPHWIVWPKGIV
jgi:hypothetical protein